MIPIARTEQLLVEELGEEVIVYDRQRDEIYCLNSLAARVWYCCDGQNSIAEIGGILAAELELAVNVEANSMDLVSRALQELESFNLVEYIVQPVPQSGISRRRMIQKAALVSGFAMGTLFPTIKSIVAPLPAMAASGMLNITSKAGVRPG
jgi:Coenzyme PQQ synthesis protein D (PqqD)